MGNQSKSTRVAVIGASGYSGEELVRLLMGHPNADLVAVTSRQYAGKTLGEVFPRFASRESAQRLKFIEPAVEALTEEADVVFLALPHGVAAEFAVPVVEKGNRVIDLSADFRIRDPEVYQEFYSKAHPAPELLSSAVYGLPEVYREETRNAQLVASPGCYPTSILLPSLPLVRAKLVHPAAIIANSLSAVSGAGRKVDLGYLFVECNESLRPYGVPKHRHLAEIEQEVSAAAHEAVTVQFTPHLIPVNRGIVSTLYLAPSSSFHSSAELEGLAAQIAQVYQDAYNGEPFVRLLGANGLPDTKNVNGSNMIEIGWRLDPRTGRLIVMSAIDNLVKGASGQAVQSFNVMCGYPETAGLE